MCIQICIIDLAPLGTSECGREINRMCMTSWVHYVRAGGNSCAFAVHMYLVCMMDLGTCMAPNYVAFREFLKDHKAAVAGFFCPAVPA